MSVSCVAPGPEHEAKHALTQWLESHGASVYWEELNHWNYDLFSIDRGGHTPQSRPDLVVEIGGYAFVIEFKAGDSKGQVYDALLQLYGYWMSHLIHEQTYRIDGREVAIDGFLTATRHSRYGRLFEPWAEGDVQTPDTMDDGRAACAEYGQLPPAEYPMTEQHVRTLWRLGKHGEETADATGAVPCLGVLLSSHLEEETLDPTPAVLWNRGRTNQAWEVLG